MCFIGCIWRRGRPNTDGLVFKIPLDDNAQDQNNTESILVLLSPGQQLFFFHGGMLLPSSAEVSQGYPNGRTLTVNVVVTYRKLFLPLIFESRDSQHNRKHSILPPALINSLTGSLLWFMAKTDYFCRLFFMANKRSEQQFYSVTAKRNRGRYSTTKQHHSCLFSTSLKIQKKHFCAMAVETYFNVLEFSLISVCVKDALVVLHSNFKHCRFLVFIFCCSILDNLGLRSRHFEFHPPELMRFPEHK